jgi:hypothetical protein
MKRQDELKRLLINNNRRLQALQERKALYGVDSPVSIQTEIEDIEIEIENLQKELMELESREVVPIVGANLSNKRHFYLPQLGVSIGLLVLITIVGLFYVFNRTDSDTFVEEFKDGSKYWPVGNFDDQYKIHRGTIVNNAYRWQIVQARKSATIGVQPDIPPVSDFELEADLRLIVRPNNLGGYGFFFRQNDKGDYHFLINDNGQYKLALWERQKLEIKDIIPWTDSSIIDVKGNNRLKVSAADSKIRLYINSKLVGDITDQTLLAGKLGLEIALKQGETATIEMRDFRLTLLTEARYNQ